MWKDLVSIEISDPNRIGHSVVLYLWSGHSEPAPTSAPWRRDSKWLGNSFLLGLNSLANHGGSHSCFYLLPRY
jgi:hypothetical protein